MSLSINEKLRAAKALYDGILSDERSFVLTRDEMLMRAWKLGGILNDLKEEIGHGKWLFWLGGNWPELGERNSQRCMAFFKSNEEWNHDKTAKFHGFELDSVRKFMWGYLPAKERLQIEGDEGIKPGLHHLTFVNQFWKYDRQLRTGHLDTFSLEVFRREIESMVRRIAEICGPDWIDSVCKSFKTPF
jgi:hypothetical protein